ASIVYYVFDVLMLGERDVISEPLMRRRKLLDEKVLPHLGDPIRESPILEASLPDLIAAVRAQGLEGLVAKRLDSPYEPYAGRTRSGFTPASRENLWRSFRGLERAACPFVNLPEAHSGCWSQGLTAEKMTECRWIKPTLVALFEFVEWTPEGHLR